MDRERPETTTEEGAEGGVRETVNSGVGMAFAEFRKNRNPNVSRSKKTIGWIVAIVVTLLMIVSGLISEPGEDNSSSPVLTVSAETRQVSALLDEGKFTAAEAILNKAIREHPDDAELYCQYVRWVANGVDIVEDPYISNPILTDDKYIASRVAAKACDIASELDEDKKAHLANIIVSGIYSQIVARHDQASGFVPDGWPSSSMATFELIWNAVELDPDECAAWADKYESLIPDFYEDGWATSAMVLGVIAGDLRSGDKGDEGFQEGTKAFTQAVASRRCDCDAIRRAASAYVYLYSADTIKQHEDDGDPQVMRLLEALRAAGYDPEELGFVSTEHSH